MKISLIILTLNEISGLKQIMQQIPEEAVEEVLAIDGGSTDGSVEYLKAVGIQVFNQENPGRGEAFKVAFDVSKGDALIFFSPDGNESPSDIPKFRPLLEKGAAIVIATRMVVGARNEEDDSVLPLRKWVNQCFTLVSNIVWNRNSYVTDAINGFRAITRDAWNQLNPDESGYTIEYQTTIRAFKNSLSIMEFPTFEGDRIGDKKGSPSFSTGLAFVQLFFKEIVSKRH